MDVRRVASSLAVVAALVAVVRADEEDKALARCKVGQWTLVKKTPGPFMEGGKLLQVNALYVYTWVSKVEGRKLTLTLQKLSDEKTPLPDLKLLPVEYDLGRKEAGDHGFLKVKALGTEEVKVKDKVLKCTKKEYTVEKDWIVTKWTSPDVPIYGVVKEVSKHGSGKELTEQTEELVDYGTSGGAERK